MAARIPTPKYSKPSGYKKATHLPKVFKLRRFYTPTEVAAHNSASDCWVSFFDVVYDLTKLVQDNAESELAQPIVNAAGTDITHWFNPDT